MSSPLVRDLLDAGIHFGHHCSRWNPKMGPYIHGRRNSIHIIDIRETLRGLLRAQKFLAQLVGRGHEVLFVGTKRQARDSVQEAAARSGMHYVNERWLGGTLTNFRTIRSRLKRLEELEALMESPAWESGYSKKMKSTLTRELRKIRRNLDGIRNMNKLPSAIVAIDVRKEKNALREADALGIPTICLTDTDSDPDQASIVIPGNDDAMRATKLILEKLADAIEEGKRSRPAAKEERVPVEVAPRQPVADPEPAASEG
ncbi:MAG: 30S ribosomal protein S2 [Phycisphaerales bacterium]|nr:30S ribosomal protein S2 [Phycisphaerales bacterium]